MGTTRLCDRSHNKVTRLLLKSPARLPYLLVYPYGNGGPALSLSPPRRLTFPFIPGRRVARVSGEKHNVLVSVAQRKRGCPTSRGVRDVGMETVRTIERWRTRQPGKTDGAPRVPVLIGGAKSPRCVIPPSRLTRFFSPLYYQKLFPAQPRSSVLRTLEPGCRAQLRHAPRTAQSV